MAAGLIFGQSACKIDAAAAIVEIAFTPAGTSEFIVDLGAIGRAGASLPRVSIFVDRLTVARFVTPSAKRCVSIASFLSRGREGAAEIPWLLANSVGRVPATI